LPCDLSSNRRFGAVVNYSVLNSMGARITHFQDRMTAATAVGRIT